MSDKWRELSRAARWEWPNRFVTQYDFSIPVSDVEAKGLNPDEMRELILERVATLCQEMSICD